MDRFTSRVRIDDSRVRFITRLFGEPCEPGTRASRVEQRKLLEVMANDQSLTTTGDVAFQKMTFKHDGERWAVECEAVVDIPMEDANGTSS